MGSGGPAPPPAARPMGGESGAMAAVRDREALQRLNFLFQAAQWVLPHSPALSRFYLSSQRGAARRLVLRLDPSIKRCVCQRCCAPLMPGGRQRLRGGGRPPRVVQHCGFCSRGRRFVCPPRPRLRPLSTSTRQRRDASPRLAPEDGAPGQ